MHPGIIAAIITAGVGAFALITVALITVWGNRRNRAATPDETRDTSDALLATAVLELQRRAEPTRGGAPADVLHQIPPPPADFTGREAELQELLSAIERGGVTISGLQGMGGIGKTVLAFKLAELLKDRYPDAQIYLDLHGASEQQPLSPADAMAHVVRSFEPAAQLPRLGLCRCTNRPSMAGVCFS